MEAWTCQADASYPFQHGGSLMTRRFRVVHVTNDLEQHNQTQRLVQFARQCDRRRFELRFLVLSKRSNVAAELEEHGWPVTALGIASGFTPGLPLKLARRF